MKQSNNVWIEEAPAHDARMRREMAKRYALIDELLATKKDELLATKKKETQMSEHDFGFTAVDEELIDTQSRKDDIIQKLRQMINPFLDKLQSNPDKAMLKWPNRAKEVADFQQKFNAIAEGSNWQGLDK